MPYTLQTEDTTNTLQNNTEADSSISSHYFKAQIKYKEPIKAMQVWVQDF